MSLKAKDIVKEYIQLSIEEKLENRPNSNYLETLLNKNISKKIIKEDPTEILRLKKEIDDKIQKKLGAYDNLSQLKNTAKKIEAVDSIYKEIEREKVKAFESYLEVKEEGEENDDDFNFDANLILSTVFMPENKEKKTELEESKVVDFRKSTLNISKIEPQFKKINFNKFNSNKILSFFEMMKNYNFDFNFESEDKKTFEGVVTVIVNSNNKYMNEFIFKDYFASFVIKFTNYFLVDYQAQIENFDFKTPPLIILISSYNEELCQYLDNKCFLETLSSKIENIDKEDFHFYLKIFINLIQNNKLLFQKILFLKLVDKFCQLLTDDEDLNNFSLFLKLLNVLSTFGVTSRKYISEKYKQIIFKKISSFFEDNKMNVLSFKFKNKKTLFLPNQSDAFLLIRMFTDQFKITIEEEMPISQYWQNYSLATSILTFLKFNKKMITPEIEEEYCKIVFTLLNNYFYIKEIVYEALQNFKNLLNKKTFAIFSEECAVNEFLHNILTPYTRTVITKENLSHLLLLQDFILNFIDVCVTKTSDMDERIIWKILHYCYAIRKILKDFHHDVKKKYLQKGVVRYVTKMESEFKNDLETEFDEILSKNGLILQKLAFEYSLTDKVYFLIKVDNGLNLIKIQDGKLEKNFVITTLDTALKGIYMVTKLKLGQEIKNHMGIFSLILLKKCEELVSYLLNEKVDVNFEIMRNILEYLVMVIYYVKTYDEKYTTPGSQMIKEKVFSIFSLIFFNIKQFVDLNSNYEIYVFLENFNLFWFSYFSFEYKFFDKINNFFFIESAENLKTRKKEKFDENLKKEILNFLNELVDLKSKCPFINFIILKQLDIFYNTFEEFSNLNSQFISKIFQKALDFTYSNQIHKINPSFIFNFSSKLLAIKELQKILIKFIYQHNLYINDFIIGVIKKSVDKNFKTEEISNIDENSNFLLRHKLFEDDLPDSKEFTKFLFAFAQDNIKKRNLFHDLILVIRKYFKQNPNEFNKSLAVKLVSKSGVFLKLLKLYKKDKINLAKIFKNFFKICKIFNIYEEIDFPKNVIKKILLKEDIHVLEDTYYSLLDYVVKIDGYKEHKNEIYFYLKKAKNFLDNCLFFLKEFFFYKQNIKSVYYCLKVFCRSENLVAESINIETNDFVVKYIIGLFEENYKIEFSADNNLYSFFNSFLTGAEDFNDHTNKFEKKIISLLLETLQKQKFEALEQDPYLITKILKFSFYTLDDENLKKNQNTYFKYLILGLQNENVDKQLFLDFYLVLFNMFNLESPEVKIFFEKQSTLSVDTLSIFSSLIDKLKFIPNNFDLLAYNDLIRNLLFVLYILKNSFSNLKNEDFRDLIKVLDIYTKDHYEKISSLLNLEKLVIEIFIIIHKAKNINSLTTANIFLDVFFNKADFKVSNKIDKYIYMGLFNSYFKRYQRKSKMILNQYDLTYSNNYEFKEEIKKKYERFKLNKDILNLMIKQLKKEDLPKSHEILISRFMNDMSYINKELVLELDFDEECLDLKLRQLHFNFDNLDSIAGNTYEFLVRRMEVVIYIIDKHKKEDDKDKLKVFFDKMVLLIENISKNATIDNRIKNTKISENSRTIFIHCLIRFLKKLYYLSTIKNYTDVKELLLTTMNKNIILENHFSIENDLIIYNNAQISYFFIKILKNQYDLIRVCQNQTIVENLLFLLTSEVLKKPENEEDEKELKPVQEINISNIQNTEYLFKRNMMLESYIEFSIFIFIDLIKNRLLLEESFKSEAFYKMEENAEEIKINELCVFLYNKLEQEFKQDGLELQEEPGEKDKEGKTKIDRKKEDFMYLGRMFTKLHENLKNNNKLQEKEFSYYKFAISGLESHLNNNLDSEIFSKFKIIKILCDFFVHESTDEANKERLIQLMRKYFEITKENNKVDFNDIKTFMYYYRVFLEEKFPELSRKYFILLEIMISYLKLDQEFVDVFFALLTDNIFSTKSEIKEHLFIGCLFIYTQILKQYELNYDFNSISTRVYNFLKINHKKMELEEKGMLAEVIVFLKKNSNNIDDLKYNNMLLFLKLKYVDEGLRQIRRVNKSIKNIVDKNEDFQEIMKMLGFESYFKMIMRKYGKSPETALEIAQLFLFYTYKMKSHFDLFETLKNILEYIEYFYLIENPELVIIFYKCLVNASLDKQNAEFLLKNELYDVIEKCFYRQNEEFYLVIISLIFNITYILNEDEIDSTDLFNPRLLRIIINMFNDSLEKKYPNIIDQLLDLFVSFIQHKIINLFSYEIISKLKLALNFNYNNEELLNKILNVIKDLCLSKDKSINNSLLKSFDYLYLYHIHFRHLSNSKINALVKQIILSLIQIKGEGNTENDFVVFGIPENIVHSFSLEDEENIIMLNLKIILLSLKFDKCILFINSYFMATLRNLIFREIPKFSEKVMFGALDILHEMVVFFRNPELMHASFYFDNMNELFKMIEFFKQDEKNLFTTIKLIKNNLETDPGCITQIDSDLRKNLDYIIANRNEIKDNIIVADVYDINNLLNSQQSIMQNKFDIFKLKGNLSAEDKMVLDRGENVILIYQDVVNKRAFIRYDFLNNQFQITNISFLNKNDNKQKTKLILDLNSVDKVDQFNVTELNILEDTFKTYFNKNIDKGLYFNIKFWFFRNQDVEVHTIYLIFENEFKGKRMRNLFDVLVKNK